MNRDHCRALLRLEPRLAAWTDRLGPVELSFDQSRDPYQALVRSVVYQQLSGAAARTIFGRFKALFPKERFPRPESVLARDPEELRGAGLSRAKALAIRDLAERKKLGELPTARQAERMSDEDLIEILTQARGVGPWTVQMYLIFRLGRPDVWPSADLGVQKGFQILCRQRTRPDARKLEIAGEKFRPYRSTAALYCWRIADFAKGDRP